MSEPNYDFIMQDKPKQKLKIVPSGNSPMTRILIFAVGAFALIIVIVVVLSLLASGKSAAADKLEEAVRQQAEIIRVAGIGADKAKGRDAKDLAITTQLSMQTDQATLLALLSKAGKKVSTKDLASVSNTQDDATLSAAEQSNQFDSSMTSLLKQLLTKYQQNLSDAYKLASPNSKPVLTDIYNHSTLITQPPK